jgi:chemotaxis signal transduction protein
VSIVPGILKAALLTINALLNMAIFSPLRLRRLADQATEATQQFITFQIAQQFCALPVDQLIKVMIMTEITDVVQPSGSKIIKYKGQDLVVWDVGKLLFGQTSFTDKAISNQHMVLGRAAHDQVVGLLIDHPPATLTVGATAVLPTNDAPGIMATISADHQYYVLSLLAIENGGSC